MTLLSPSRLAVLSAGLLAGVLGAASPLHAQSRSLPRGSYVQSCNQANVERGRLSARCLNTRGDRIHSSIEVARCGSQSIDNDDGRLVCGAVRGDVERPRSGPQRPGVSGPERNNGRRDDDRRAGAITVWLDLNFTGRSQTFTGEVANLRSVNLNDTITSLRVTRGDAWEVCEDANFRGRCQIVRGDQRDLRPMGLNDRISSLRPVPQGRR